MSIVFCEETLINYIKAAPCEIKNHFYLSNAILLKVKQGGICLRIENGEWCNLSTNNICFLPKGKVIEFIKKAVSEKIALDIMPVSAEMLNYFYKQNSALFIEKKKTHYHSQVCTTDISNTPILGEVFYSAIQEIRHLEMNTDTKIKNVDNKMAIHLNFVLSFFLLENTFYPTLQTSMNVLTKDKVYDYIYHNSGKQHCTLELIAKQLHMSTSTLKRRLASEDTNFSTISLTSRMNKAMMLSKVDNMPMPRIAQEVGYDDIPHFIQAFKNFYQQSQPLNVTIS
ncbi:helix-turn-helix domain-containing protein [Providencia alcalifaciens]|uniref:helix-turn-helix domain-containing protein n=1 Tax=Providencia alcalifaciens TaxID=126385 RepID=UPI003D2D63EA